MTTRSVIGDAPKRREDLRFITGSGRYLDDIVFEGLAHAVVLRSPHAHALIERTGTEHARAAPGVLAVLTVDDVRADGLEPLLPSARANPQTGEPFAFSLQPLLAEGKVRYVGEPVALIVAGTRAEALDAAEMVMVDYSPLPAVTTAAAARASGTPEISDEVPGQCLPRLADRRCRRGRRGFRGGGAYRRASARQSPDRHQPDRAARRHRPLECE
jgi:aerobic carbon-monoxide dehydrogenase large subunit